MAEDKKKKFVDEEIFLDICRNIKNKFIIPKEKEEIIKIESVPEQAYMIKVQELKYYTYGRILTIKYSLYTKESRFEKDKQGSGIISTRLKDMLYYLKSKPMIFSSYEEAKLIIDLMG